MEKILCVCTNSEYQASPQGEGAGDDANLAIHRKYQSGTDFSSFQVFNNITGKKKVLLGSPASCYV